MICVVKIDTNNCFFCAVTASQHTLLQQLLCLWPQATQVDSSRLKPSQRTRYSHFPYTMDSSMLLLTPIAAIAILFYFLVHVSCYQYLLVWSSGRPTYQRGNSPLAAESRLSRTRTEDEGGWYSSWQGSGTDQQLRLSLAYSKTHAVDTCVRAYVPQPWTM